jgi:uncharacterized membrane protein YebE (DUF533 family)
MDAEALIGSLIRGTLTGRKKRGRRALSYLSGGGNSLLNANTLLTVAGLAWGVLESVGSRSTERDSQGQWGNPGQGGVPRPVDTPSSAPSPPPLRVPPPAPADALDPAVLQVVRLIISAARADGALSAAEQEVILAHARQVGAESIIGRELDATHPLSDIVAGISDPKSRDDLYTLAFTVVHADEGVTGAERIFLVQLATYLGLESQTVRRLETAAIGGISAAAAG